MTPRPGPLRELPQVPLAKPPPFRLPGEHFLAAGAWLLVVALLLPSVAVSVAEGRVFEPAVFAAVHAGVLGVLASSIFGALNQFVPGGLEVPLRSVRLGHAGFWLLQAGTAVLVTGFWLWDGRAQAAGWLLVFGAVGAASANILPARRRSPHGQLVGLYLSVAHSALGLAMVIALARIGETLGWWHVDRLRLLGAHALLGAVGFGTLTAIGVGSRMLPTFLVAHGNDAPRLKVILALFAAGLSAVTAGAVSGLAALTTVGAGLLVAGAVATLELAGRWFRRKSRTLDAPLLHVATAFVGLALATAWGAVLVATDAFALRRWAAFLIALILGWLVMLVAGVMGKLVPHLSYIHLFRSMPGFGRVGDPNRLLDRRWLMVSWILLAAGAVGLPFAVDAGAVGLAQVAAGIWSAGAVVTLATHGRMFARGRWPDGARGRVPGRGD